jgi:hypothetical protein
MEWSRGYFEEKKSRSLYPLILTLPILDIGLGQYQPPGQVF